MPTGVDVCRWFKIPSQGPRTPQFARHTRDHHAGGITAETCPHAAIDHRGNEKAYYTQCSACRIYIEYYPFVGADTQMVIAGLRMLSGELQRETLTDKERAILKQACATLKNPLEVAGPRSSAWNGGLRSMARNGHRSKANGPRQEATHGRDVPDESWTKGWVIVQQDGREVTELLTDDTRADVHICDICKRDLYGDELYKEHMNRHRFKEDRHWDEDNEISRGAFNVMVRLASDPKASAKTIEILTELAGLLHLELPKNLRIQEGSSS
jgi:hypothetical protein